MCLQWQFLQIFPVTGLVQVSVRSPSISIHSSSLSISCLRQKGHSLVTVQWCVHSLIFHFSAGYSYKFSFRKSARNITNHKNKPNPLIAANQLLLALIADPVTIAVMIMITTSSINQLESVIFHFSVSPYVFQIFLNTL